MPTTPVSVTSSHQPSAWLSRARYDCTYPTGSSPSSARNCRSPASSGMGPSHHSATCGRASQDATSGRSAPVRGLKFRSGGPREFSIPSPIVRPAARAPEGISSAAGRSHAAYQRGTTRNPWIFVSCPDDTDVTLPVRRQPRSFRYNPRSMPPANFPTDPLAGEDAELGSTQRVLRLLDKTSRAARTYGLDNAATTRFFEQLQSEMGAHLEKWSVLGMVVERGDLLVRDQLVFQSEEGAGEGLVFRLYGDGIRELRFHQGAGPEDLRAFLEALWGSDKDSDADDDIVT